MTDSHALTAPVVLRDDLSGDIAIALIDVERVAWDIETSGLDFRNEQIGTCQLYAPEVGTIIVQLNGHRPTRLSQLLASPRVLKVFHHAPFDLRFMAGHWGVAPQSVTCTEVASKLLDPHAPNQGSQPAVSA